MASRLLEEVREVFFGGDEAAGQPELEGLAGEHLDLLLVLLVAVGVEVLAHHCVALLAPRPRRRTSRSPSCSSRRRRGGSPRPSLRRCARARPPSTAWRTGSRAARRRRRRWRR